MTAAQGLGLLLIIVLAGCMSSTGDNRAETNYDPVVYRDRVTGCEYLATGSTQFLTPRLRADGTHVCANPAKETL